MFNSINSFNSKDVESCYAMIKASEKGIICTVIDAKTEKILLRLPFFKDEIKDFIKKIHFKPEIYKAVIIDAFQHQSRQFCIDLREKLNKLQIPNYFISHENFMISSLLIAANININFDETIIIILSKPKDIFLAELLLLKFTPNGYERIRKNVIKLEEKNETLKISEKIMATSTPKKILVLQYPSSPSIKTFLKSKKMVIFNNNVLQYIENFLIETCKWLLDKSYMKYYILPSYDRSFYFYGSYYPGDEIEKLHMGSVIMSLLMAGKLPFTESKYFERNYLSCWLRILRDKREFRKLELSRDCHRFKFTMDIDTESFETYKIEQIFLEEIQSLPKNLDTVMKTKIPVIGFFDNSSIVCICKNGSYEFSDSCNGLYGLDNFISFDEKKPKYGEAALKMMNQKPSYVVFDLLKILSMPADNIKISKSWKFTITKDCDNPILIEFDDFKSGKRTAASPAFLMALLIKKQYLKAITPEIGEKPSEIGIWISHKSSKMDELNKEKMKRMKKGFEDACDLIKIKCCFVEC